MHVLDGKWGKKCCTNGRSGIPDFDSPVSLSLPRPLCVHVVIKCEEWTLSSVQSKFVPTFSFLKLPR